MDFANLIKKFNILKTRLLYRAMPSYPTRISINSNIIKEWKNSPLSHKEKTLLRHIHYILYKIFLKIENREQRQKVSTILQELIYHLNHGILEENFKNEQTPYTVSATAKQACFLQLQSIINKDSKYYLSYKWSLYKIFLLLFALRTDEGLGHFVYKLLQMFITEYSQEQIILVAK